MAKHGPRVKQVTYKSACDYELKSACKTVVTLTSEHLSTAFKLRNRKNYHVLPVMLDSSLFFVVECRGGGTEAGEESRINIVVKKVASCVAEH